MPIGVLTALALAAAPDPTYAIDGRDIVAEWGAIARRIPVAGQTGLADAPHGFFYTRRRQLDDDEPLEYIVVSRTHGTGAYYWVQVIDPGDGRMVHRQRRSYGRPRLSSAAIWLGHVPRSQAGWPTASLRPVYTKYLLRSEGLRTEPERLVNDDALATYRGWIGGLDANIPANVIVASGYLTKHPTGGAATHDAAIGLFLDFFARIRQRQTAALAAIEDPRARYERAYERHATLQPHGMTLLGCEEMSHQAVEMPGFIIRQLASFPTPAAARFLRLRETEVQLPLGAGCEGLPRAEISASEYAWRRQGWKVFVERYPDFALAERARRYLAQYEKSYDEYIGQFQR